MDRREWDRVYWYEGFTLWSGRNPLGTPDAHDSFNVLWLHDCYWQEMSAAMRAVGNALRWLARCVLGRSRRTPEATIARETKPMRCDVNLNELACLRNGGLGSDREAEVKQHVTECEACRQRLDALEDTDEILAELPLMLPPKRQVQTVLVGVALANLPDRQRQAIGLRVTEGLSDRKIAAALGVPVDVAQSLIARARSNLARALGPLDNPNVRYEPATDESVRGRLGVPVSV